MPDIPSALPVARAWPARRWALLVLLLLALLLIGIYDEQTFAFLTLLWQRLLAATGMHRMAAASQGGTEEITKRFLPTVVTYAVLYLGICLALLRLALAPAQWRMAVRLYAGMLALYLGLVLFGRLAGNAAWAYQLGRQIRDFLVSPLPMAGLYVLFRAGFGPRATHA